MRRLHIVICVIEQGDEYILQFRNGDPKIGGAGLIGFFGGKIGDNEEALLAICRELGEETSLTPGPHDIRELGQVEVMSDHQLEPVQVFARVFHLLVDPMVKVKALEGELVRLAKPNAHQHVHKMTTGTRAVFEQLLVEPSV